jgi:hypothetical protein
LGEPVLATEISTDPASVPLLAEMQEAIAHRFPALHLLEFSDHSACRAAKLPQFVGLIATILESADKPCCIVLPACSGVAIAVSSLLAITRLRAEFPELLRTHASISFKQGLDHVLVHPCGLVYRYEGFFTPDFFKLKVVDKNEWRSLPVTDIARLEKTNHKRPKGYLTSDLQESQPFVLGSILGIKTSLNRNFLRNRVLLLGARKGLVDELDGWTIQITPPEGVISRSLKDEVPFGKVLENGELAFLDGYVTAGEPLVAIASRVEDLAAHCASAEQYSKSVLVNDIDELTNNLRAYDSITENQRTVILATDAERDSIRLLEDRGCDIWRFTTDELLLGLNPSGNSVPLADVLKKASKVRNLVISELPCNEESLDRAADELRGAAEATTSADNGSIRELFYSLFGLLMLCAEYLGSDSEKFTSAVERLLGRAHEHLRTARVWLRPETFNQINSALSNMHFAAIKLAESGNTPKGKILIDALKTADSRQQMSTVVVARSNVVDVEKWINQSGVRARVYSISDIAQNDSFGQVLMLSWPRSARFDDLVHSYVTTDLRLLAYRFEEKWLNQYRSRYKRSAVPEMLLKRKLQLLGISANAIENEEATENCPLMPESVKFDIPEEQFLARRKGGAKGTIDPGAESELFVDASYIDFIGKTFAYLTEGHEVAVLNNYISEETASGTKMPMRSVGDMKAGDYLLFRESGDSDIIRFLAEDEVGKEQYQNLRAAATRWRTALNSLGADPKEVWNRLRAVGFSRHLQTVKGWMVNDTRICPRDLQDVRKIAEASSDHELIAVLPRLWEAKEELMSLHISAGFRLTQLLMKELPHKLGVLGRGETELDLGVGKIWIVRIQDIDRSQSIQRRSHVNRLLWDETGLADG